MVSLSASRDNPSPAKPRTPQPSNVAVIGGSNFLIASMFARPAASPLHNFAAPCPNSDSSGVVKTIPAILDVPAGLRTARDLPIGFFSPNAKP